MRVAWSLPAALAVLLGGCQSPSGQPAAPQPVALPAEFPAGEERVSRPSVPSDWSSLGEPALVVLIEQAWQSSPQLLGILARIEESRARLGLVQAEAGVQATVSPSARVAGETAERTLPLPGQSVRYRERGDYYRVPLEVAYEVDLWGRVRLSRAASASLLQASNEDWQAARLSLATEIAQTYFLAQGAAAELAAVQTLRDARRAQAALLAARVKAGLANELEQWRVDSELALLESESHELHRRQVAAGHALATLCGAPAGTVLPPDAPADFKPPTFAAGLPTDLLSRRPDLRAAAALAEARAAEVGAALVAHRPTLRLLGSAGVESADLGSLLERPAQFWQLGPSLSYTLFDGGRSRANTALARARLDAAVADYHQRTLQAFREVSDALIDEKALAAQAQALHQALLAARAAEEIVTARYNQGLASYLEVIDAQRARTSVERTTLQVQTLQRQAALRLFKAIGGPWPEASLNSVGAPHA